MHNVERLKSKPPFPPFALPQRLTLYFARKANATYYYNINLPLHDRIQISWNGLLKNSNLHNSNKQKTKAHASKCHILS